MGEVAAAWDAAADVLAHAARSLPDAAVSADVFGADGAGRPGQLGRALHTRVDAMIDARAREAGAAAARLTDTAQAVRHTLQAYDRADEAAARRLRQVP